MVRLYRLVVRPANVAMNSWLALGGRDRHEDFNLHHCPVLGLRKADEHRHAWIQESRFGDSHFTAR